MNKGKLQTNNNAQLKIIRILTIFVCSGILNILYRNVKLYNINVV